MLITTLHHRSHTEQAQHGTRACCARRHQSTQNMQSNTPSPFDLIKNIVSETFKGKTAEDLVSDKRKQKRIDLLAMKMHTVGAVSLPLPNLMAFQLISKLDTEDSLNFTMESLYILQNQTCGDALFTKGIERQVAITEFVKDIKAHEWTAYYVCIREMLEELEKKTISSSMKMTETAQNLISQATSLFSQKPTDNPSPTSTPK